LQLCFYDFVGEELTLFAFVKGEYERPLRTTGLVIYYIAIQR